MQPFQETSSIYKENVGQQNPRKSSSRQGVEALLMDNRTQKLSYSSNIKRTRTVVVATTRPMSNSSTTSKSQGRISSGKYELCNL